jgi:hypothetical protein
MLSGEHEGLGALGQQWLEAKLKEIGEKSEMRYAWSSILEADGHSEQTLGFLGQVQPRIGQL